MEEEEQPGQKIPLVEGLLIGSVLVIVAVINLMPFAGDFTSLIIAAFMFFYLYQKGLLGTTELVANGVAFIVGLIPILQAFPAWLVSWPVTVWVANHPKLAAAAGKVGELTGKGAIGGAADGATKAGEAAKDAGAATAKETGAKAGQGANQESAATGQEAAAAERGGEAAGGGAGEEMSEEEAAKRTKEEEIEKQMRLGAEVPPEEEAREAVFVPKEIQFKEAKPKTQDKE